MIEVVVKEKIRLDELVFKHFKTLDVFDKVLTLNSHLNSKFYLDVGDIVYLPDIQNFTREKKVQTLW